ncbi:hypothetical protein PCASD_20194 [Puccinia coronata f. sp. avenae]|uniref:Hydrophobin n=1 Tax=Puccinia coronata f. sp. avenae TaxID=200324 RepID=A0A2N5SMX7_9BASI|nr:hypothetical protein PCASD_20194 [Puccinia coronata f. sp. avenae]
MPGPSLRRILVALAILAPSCWAGTSLVSRYTCLLGRYQLGEQVYLFAGLVPACGRELNAEDLNQEATDISLNQTLPLALPFSLVTSAPIILGCCPQQGQCHRHPIAFVD